MNIPNYFLRQILVAHVLQFLTSPYLVHAASSYAPQGAACPQGDISRSGGQGLSSAEANWIQNRDAITQEALTGWLLNSNLDNINIPDFMSTVSRQGTNTIRIGLAFSGGGFRAMLAGAGMLAALDSRTEGALQNGGLGGLLQASSYMAGLSGGAWLVSSLAVNDWATIPSLQANKHLWNFQSSLNPTVDRHFLPNFQPDWDFSIIADVGGKSSAGFPISVTDIWGRLLSAQLIGGKDNGRGKHWSDLCYDGPTSKHQMPLPILVSDGVSLGNDSSVNSHGDISVTLNSTVYEISPFEFGSWDPTVYSFVNTQYLGTDMLNGIPTSSECIVGYDNVGFLVGASSAVFNKMVQSVVTGPLGGFFNTIFRMIGGIQQLEMAVIGSNPFKEMTNVAEKIKHAPDLDLVDGGEDGQNLPFAPLIQAEREIDVIFAMDNSADTMWNWPNGNSLLQSYERQFLRQGNGTIFPYIPNPDVFLNLGLNLRPTFFGCDVDVYKQAGVDPPPLIIYVPNSYHVFPSNQSTFKLNYSARERDEMIRNGYSVMTQNNGTTDPEWRSCAACAIILREHQRRNIESTDQCEKCFSRYCYRSPLESGDVL